jgi:catechol 2,3-dioxygenase-like lactoylglutathione lyase family enzyme
MNPTLTHFAIQAEDFEGCVAFYERYCAMSICHRRSDGNSRVAWLAEAGREKEFIIVIINGGQRNEPAQGDFGHLGFAVGSREEVDSIASRAQGEGILVWPPRQENYPVGYFCGVRDPDGNCVEFSFGQPLGPGAEGVPMPGIEGE